MENVITKKNIMSKLSNGAVKSTELAIKASLDRYIVLKSNDNLKRLQSCLDSEGYALVVKSEGMLPRKIKFFFLISLLHNYFLANDFKRENLMGIANSDDFLSFLTSF